MSIFFSDRPFTTPHGDQLLDGAEVYDYDTSPTDSDTDDDGLSDGYEVFTSQTDPNEWDTDDDWLND